jgi:surface protein
MTKILYVFFLMPLLLIAAPLDDFVITVKTDNPGTTTNTEFHLPIGTTSGIGYNVDCNNDGTDEVTGKTGNDGYTCTYTVAGTYTIRVKDNNGNNKGFRKIKFNNSGDVKKILNISQWGSTIWSSMSNSFYGALHMTVTAIDIPDFSELGSANGASLARMFRGCTQLTTLGNDNWDMSRITNMQAMFRGASIANPDVSNWDTSSLTNIKNMFYNAVSFDRDMSGWDVSNITDATRFLRYVTLSIKNYDALLSSWGNQNVKNNVKFHGGTSKFCAGEEGRNLLLGNSWTITDGGKNCGGVCAAAVGDLTEDHWTTISFPCDTGSNGIEVLLKRSMENTLGVGNANYGDAANWIVYEQRGDFSGTSDSMQALDAGDPVEPGKGYWIIADNNTTWYIDDNSTGNLTDMLSYSSTVKASSLSISSSNFDYVHKRDLPNTGVNQQKLLLGNPFPDDINISDVFFSNSGTAFSPLDQNGASVNDVVYTYDATGSSINNYQAISATTPGFDKVIHQQGFWLRLKPSSTITGTNRITFPKMK